MAEDNKWDKLTEKPDSGWSNFTYGVRLLGNIGDWWYWNWLVPVFFVILLGGGWVLVRSVTQKYKEIDGHAYVRTGAYNFSHSPKCWCEEKK